MGKNDFCNILVDKVFKVYNYRHTNLQDWIIKDVLDDLEEGKNTDKYEIKDDGKLYCNLEGAEDIADRTGADFSIYSSTLGFINSISMLTEDKIPLDVDISLTYDDELFEVFKDTKLSEEFLNECISDTIVGMSTIGKQLKDIDPIALSNKDRQTINGSVDKYRIVAKDGHDQPERIKASYDYINTNDPDIISRMVYSLNPTTEDIDEQYMKYRKLDFDEITLRLQFNKSKKSIEERREKFRIKKDKKKDNKKNKKKK